MAIEVKYFKEEFIASSNNKVILFLKVIYKDSKIIMQLELFYKEMLERFKHLQAQEQTEEIKWRIAEIKLSIVRVQQLMLSSNINKSEVLNSNLSNFVNWYTIKVINNKREIVEYLSFSGLKWELRLKYDWYFKYRSALFQVQYPKFEVQNYWGKEPAKGKTLEEIRSVKISSKKATITKAKNNLSGYLKEFENYKLNYAELFPITEKIQYQEFLKNIELLNQKINRLEFELRTL